MESTETEERGRAGESLSKENKTGKWNCCSLVSLGFLLFTVVLWSLNKDTQLVRKKTSEQQGGPFSQVLRSLSYFPPGDILSIC